jgi:cytochrome b6-f complex iron-sulfur subunit
VIVVVAIVVLLLLAVGAIVAMGRRRSSIGQLDRDAIKQDRSEPPADALPEPATGTEVAALDEEARQRAADSRQALEPVGARAPVEYVPVDDEEIGLTRRQFFNRGILTGLGIFTAGFGVAMLGFLWPQRAGGFGAVVDIGTTGDAQDAFDKKIPFYNASAKTYLVAYPEDDLPKAEKVYPPNIFSGMEQGYVALYQRCVHLGCRVPWCDTSQWFECPCHGSKYNRVGEKRGGPAPRGLDRFPLEVSGGSITVDTGTIVQGPPIGTDTTGQAAEGAPCV